MQIADFAKYVLPHTPGAPSAMVRQAIIDSATEFLTDTRVWGEVQEPLTLQAGLQQYDMDAPSGARCIEIREIYAPYLPAGRLKGVTLDELARIMPDWRSATGNGPFLYTRAFEYGSFSVYPMPVAPLAANATLIVHGVYTLTENANTIPDDIVARYREPIAAGAKYRLMSMPEKPWSNPKLADKAEFDFKSGKNKARIKALHDNTTGSHVVTPRTFGRW